MCATRLPDRDRPRLTGSLYLALMGAPPEGETTLAGWPRRIGDARWGSRVGVKEGWISGTRQRREYARVGRLLCAARSVW